MLLTLTMLFCRLFIPLVQTLIDSRLGAAFSFLVVQLGFVGEAASRLSIGSKNSILVDFSDNLELLSTF